MALIPLTDIPIQLQDSVTSDNMSGGTLEFYDGGTTTTQALYIEDGTSVGTSVTLNSGGYPESGGSILHLWRDASASLDVVCKNANGAIVWTANLPAVGLFTQADADKLAGLSTDADATTATTVGAVVNGSQTEIIYMGGGNSWLPTTSAAGALAVVEPTANYPTLRGYPFDATTSERVHAIWVPPKRADGSNVRLRFYWHHDTSTTGGVVWEVRTIAQSDGEAYASPLGSNWGTAQTVADTSGGADTLYVSDWTSTFTVQPGTYAHGDVVWFEFSRDPADVSDTLAADAYLVAVELQYVSDALNDD